MKTIWHWISRLPALLEFFLFYLKDVISSNLRVAHDVLTPTHNMRPAFLSLNVEGLTDRQLLAAANLITMTPGTLSIDVSEDRRRLHVHAMYVNDVGAEEKELENNYVRRIRNVF